MKPYLTIILISLLPALSYSQVTTLTPLETVHVKQSNVFWKAELDSSSETTVINASSIAVMNASFPMEKNITKQISFKLRNADGQGRTVNGIVSGVAEWNGEKYYTAVLDIGYKPKGPTDYRKVECVLADLSGREHRLIIGKNWLRDDIEVK